MPWLGPFSFFFFFNDTATTEIYTLSLHDALPISPWLESRAPVWSRARRARHPGRRERDAAGRVRGRRSPARDRKSTRLNSSHLVISYAVFCLKKKKTDEQLTYQHAHAIGESSRLE